VRDNSYESNEKETMKRLNRLRLAAVARAGLLALNGNEVAGSGNDEVIGLAARCQPASYRLIILISIDKNMPYLHSAEKNDCVPMDRRRTKGK